MLRVAIKQLKVLNRVVLGIVIPVMHNLSCKQRTAKMLLHYKAMLVGILLLSVIFAVALCFPLPVYPEAVMVIWGINKHIPSTINNASASPVWMAFRSPRTGALTMNRVFLTHFVNQLCSYPRIKSLR